MTTIIPGVLALVGAAALCAGCSVSGDESSDVGSGQWYEKTCLQTFCESCREEISSHCSECHRICRDSSCSSTCTDICHTECRSCSGESACEEWAATMPLPALDQRLYDVCLEATDTCSDTDYSQSYCNYVARTLRPEAIAPFSCWLDHSCDLTPCSPKPNDAPPTLGHEYCDRAAACSRDCREGDVAFLNDRDSDLRPELERGLRHCIAEETCEEFRACAQAYDDLWQLAWERADPGTPSACAESYLSECGACDCGFECIQTCDTCTPRCAIPCRSDADCAGTSVGVAATPVCQNYSSDEVGYCYVDLDSD